MRERDEGAESAKRTPWGPGWFKLPPPAWQPSGRVLTPNERVLLAVVDHAIRSDEQLSNDELKERTGMCRSTVIALRLALVKDGVITAVGGRGPGAEFVFGWGAKASRIQTLSEAESVQNTDALGSESVHESVPISDALGSESVQNPDATPLTQEVREEAKKGSRASTRAPAPARESTPRDAERDASRASLVTSWTRDAETVRTALYDAHVRHRGARPGPDLSMGTSHSRAVVELAKWCRETARDRGVDVGAVITPIAECWASSKDRQGAPKPLRWLVDDPAQFERPPSAAPRQGDSRTLPSRSEHANIKF